MGQNNILCSICYIICSKICGIWHIVISMPHIPSYWGRNSDRKSMVYHKILSEILSDLKNIQNVGIYWKLKYPDGHYYDVKLYFPISMCVVDIKGGKQLCGMYSSYFNISRPCISCNCHSKDLTDTNKNALQ